MFHTEQKVLCKSYAYNKCIYFCVWLCVSKQPFGPSLCSFFCFLISTFYPTVSSSRRQGSDFPTVHLLLFVRFVSPEMTEIKRVILSEPQWETKHKWDMDCRRLCWHILSWYNNFAASGVFHLCAGFWKIAMYLMNTLRRCSHPSDMSMIWKDISSCLVGNPSVIVGLFASCIANCQSSIVIDCIKS